MYTINTETIAEAHEATVKLIMGSVDFNEIRTEDNEHTFELPEPLNIHIRYPARPPYSSPALMFGPQALDAYAEQILKPRRLIDRPGAPDFSYLYSNLIFDFPNEDPSTVFDGNGKLLRVEWTHGNGRKNGTDQIDYVIRKLISNPTSRRAVVSLFEPKGHPVMDDPPCLNHIQFMIRNGELNCHALFRSNDMLSAWGGNAYALMNLQKFVLGKINDRLASDATKYEIGWLETTSISAHIYFKRDRRELDEFKKRWC